MSSWVNDQYKTNLPAAVLKSPRSFGCFIKGVECALNEWVTYISTESGFVREREDVVKRLCGVMQTASKDTIEKTRSLMFIAHQIVSDLEELVSRDGERGLSPFLGDFIAPGYGGREGFTAMDHKEILGREYGGPGYRDWSDKTSPAYFVEVCQMLEKYMETKMDKLMLAMLGLEKTEGRIRVTMTGRYISLSDFEHKMCKLYIGCMRSRGTRNSGAPKPWRDYCWPSKKDDTV